MGAGAVIMVPKPARRPLIEWGASVFRLAGEAESGDLHLVKLVERGALVAVVDGAGHGSDAALVARLAVATLERGAGSGIIGLVQRCHEELKGTRGVVMSLASFDGVKDQMTWMGIGNVETLLLRAGREARPDRETIVLRAGLVGYKLPALAASVVTLGRGDTLIFATDGIRSNFADSIIIEDTPQEIADRTCSNFKKGSDDALVLVVRYLGWNS